MVAVKQIGLEGLKEEEIAQLMREVDLVKRLSHPSIVKYEGMARDENTLSIVLECVLTPSFLSLFCGFVWLLRNLVILSTLTSWHHHVQICRERIAWADP
jgi:serine/threonine protein kinase